MREPLQKRALRFAPCLVCGVDSGPVLTFFLWLVGAAILGTIAFLVWAISNKKLLNDEQGGALAIEAEKEGMRNSNV